MPFRSTTSGTILLFIILTVAAAGISIQLNVLETFIQNQQQNRVLDQQKGYAIVNLINNKLDNIGNRTQVLLKDIIAGNTTGAKIQKTNAAILQDLANTTHGLAVKDNQLLNNLFSGKNPSKAATAALESEAMLKQILDLLKNQSKTH